MPRESVEIRTQDGVCPITLFTPNGAGPWPAVIFYMDGLGIRPALHAMAQRIADEGFVVLLPDLFYRAGPYAPFDPKAIFAAGNFREVLGPFFASTNSKKAGAEDTRAFIAYLDTRNDVRGRKIGTTGYCMGGAMALTAAGSYPDRVAAAASFHGGNLATDADISAHLLAPAMKGEIYVGAAVDDNSYPPEMEARLKAAFDAAHVRCTHETYEGALHGWTMPDFPIYNHDQAERAHRALIALLRRQLC
jgi:carboxymethylenebutenolidase